MHRMAEQFVADVNNNPHIESKWGFFFPFSFPINLLITKVLHQRAHP